MLKDAILLIVGAGFVALSRSLFGPHDTIFHGNRGDTSAAAGVFILGLILIAMAVLDWRYRSRNRPQPKVGKRGPGGPYKPRAAKLGN